MVDDEVEDLLREDQDILVFPRIVKNEAGRFDKPGFGGADLREPDGKKSTKRATREKGGEAGAAHIGESWKMGGRHLLGSNNQHAPDRQGNPSE